MGKKKKKQGKPVLNHHICLIYGREIEENAKGELCRHCASPEMTLEKSMFPFIY